MFLQNPDPIPPVLDAKVRAQAILRSFVPLLPFFTVSYVTSWCQVLFVWKGNHIIIPTNQLLSVTEDSLQHIPFKSYLDQNHVCFLG